MHYDGNIADKMSDREAMLRKALDKVGLGYLKIFNIVTFTNPRLDIENKYHRIKVCGSNYLPIFIDKFQSDNWYSDENIGTMVNAVEDSRCKEPFQILCCGVEIYAVDKVLYLQLPKMGLSQNLCKH